MITLAGIGVGLLVAAQAASGDPSSVADLPAVAGSESVSGVGAVTSPVDTPLPDTAPPDTLPSDAPELRSGLQPGAATDFSVMAMFLRATITVKVVMAVLVLASFWSWAIIIEKWIAFARLRGQSSRFEDGFWSGQPLDELYDRISDRSQTPIERVFVSGMVEWRRSFGEGNLIPGTQQRVDRAMSVAIARETETINKRLPFLASVGSVAPFVGLFGTVWGIKHSFESIAIQQNTNLAVVAPGIAEALLATALGLLAAIPAVMAYNRLIGEAASLTGALENFADEFSTILGRQIDRRGVAEAA